MHEANINDTNWSIRKRRLQGGQNKNDITDITENWETTQTNKIQ